ncbi:MAG: ATP-dependent helicase HrpB [Gammaproteobacteria bacterium]
MSLPIDELLPRLVATLNQHSSVVVQAPPGAGKTTRVPLALQNCAWLGNKKIIMLEPRRLAARSAARFMAQSLNERVGETVGYRVRFDNRTGPKTRIEVVTEGILTRLLQDDPTLQAYGVLIFDEFHERNLNSDLGLALCIDAQQGLREDLKIIVMSATLDGAAVSSLLHDAPMLTSEGRSFPVAIHHQAPGHSFARERRGFLAEVAQRIMRVLQQEQGSVLVFLPGAGEIRQVTAALQEALHDSKSGKDILLAPLSGQLSAAEQDAAIQPAPEGKRKIVLATAIAETSLTIEGIRIVIDSGLMRLPRFDPNTGLTQLVTLPVSQASADQRCGRAGRLQAGVCYRLWKQGAHLLAQTPAEILDADLAPLLLELAQWGVSDVNALRWIDPPPAPHVAQARDLLMQLGALDHESRITPHGKAMAQWGVHPRLAHMLLRAKAIGAGALACDVAAILSDRDIFRGTVERESDLQLRVDAMRDRAGRDQASRDQTSRNSTIDNSALRQAQQASAQYQQQLSLGAQSSPEDSQLLGVVLAWAYPDRIGRRRDNSSRYLLSNGRGAILNEGDALSTHEYIVAAHLDGAREARIFLAAGIHREHLLHYHADNIVPHSLVQWDDRQACVQARVQQRIGEVVIDDAALQDVDPDAVLAALLEGIRLRGLACLPWNDAARALQARMQFMHQQLDPGWPDVSEAALLVALENWLQPYLANMSRLSHLARLDLSAILLAQLSWQQQQQLDQLVPTHISVPSGSRIRVDYSHFPPVLAVRLQEMFGLADTPRIAQGKIAVLLHLLSPAQRPVQITQDLAGFWQSSYHDVKKDLKGRYPKHHWPDDPLQAQATKRTKHKRE